MARRWLWVSGIIVVLIVAIILFALRSSANVPAQLHVESGTVTVNGNVVTGTIELDEGDVIATGEGTATVFLYESVVVSLEKDTSVTLDDLTRTHPKISQKGGKSWSVFTKLVGVVDYSISTDKAVASVRGTAFALSEGKLLVGEGTVSYDYDGKTFLVAEKRVVENGIERAATPEELAEIKAHLQHAVGELQYLRKLEIDDHPFLVKTAMTLYGVTEEEVNQKLAEADAGAINVDDALAKAPFHLAALDKIADITKAIQKVNQEIAG
ncbi:MAG TPA: hypothetical protein VLJ21_01795 [Candidatus Binatia bacterium]|nr:hypothetical protein [Candidatus Binatia bacterium]